MGSLKYAFDFRFSFSSWHRIQLLEITDRRSLGGIFAKVVRSYDR
jgi:hypothetical protein